MSDLLARPAVESIHGELYLLLPFIFNDSCLTNYLEIYRTNLRQIFRVGRRL